MYLGDNFTLGGITPQVNHFRADRLDAQIMLTRVPDLSAYGVAVPAETGRVTGLQEKPQEPLSDLAVVGIYLFTSAIHDSVRAVSPSLRGELEITDAIQWLIDEGHDIRPAMISSYWKGTAPPPTCWRPTARYWNS